MTPGGYIRQCREACGFSLEDIALMLESTPPVSCRSRAELLAQIEAGTVPVSLSTAFALANVRIGVDLLHLAELVDLAAAESRATPRLRPVVPLPLFVNIGGDVAAPEPPAPMLLGQGGESGEVAR